MADRETSPYSSSNAGVRVEVFDQAFEPDYEVAVRGFLRRAGIGHLYAERIEPTLRGGDAAVFVGVADRVWPPWGLGAHEVLALCQAHVVGDRRYGVSPVFVASRHSVNIGLIAAVYKEALEHVAHARGEVNYLVRQGARYSTSTLAAAGFSRVDEFFQTQAGRYYIHRVPAAQLIDYLGLSVSTADLLAEDVPPQIFSVQAAFFSAIMLASILAAELIAIDGGLDDSLPPATITGTAGDLGPLELGDPFRVIRGDSGEAP